MRGLLPRLFNINGAVAQFGRAPRSQCGGQGFEPPLLHQEWKKGQADRKRKSAALFFRLRDPLWGLSFQSLKSFANRQGLRFFQLPLCQA